MGGVSHGRLDFVKSGRGIQAVVGTLSTILARASRVERRTTVPGEIWYVEFS